MQLSQVDALRLTMSRNDANVSWYALMIHVDSPSDMSMDFTIAGIAENRAELLKASRNCAKQKVTSKVYRRAGE